MTISRTNGQGTASPEAHLESSVILPRPENNAQEDPIRSAQFEPRSESRKNSVNSITENTDIVSPSRGSLPRIPWSDPDIIHDNNYIAHGTLPRPPYDTVPPNMGSRRTIEEYMSMHPVNDMFKTFPLKISSQSNLRSNLSMGFKSDHALLETDNSPYGTLLGSLASIKQHLTRSNSGSRMSPAQQRIQVDTTAGFTGFRGANDTTQSNLFSTASSASDYRSAISSMENVRSAQSEHSVASPTALRLYPIMSSDPAFMERSDTARSEVTENNRTPRMSVDRISEQEGFSPASTRPSSGAAAPSRRARKEKKTPRPPNSFIIYRGEKHKEIKLLNPLLSNNEISRIVGDAWQQESPNVRAEFEEKAQIKKREHREMYPDYKFKPKKEKKHKVDPSATIKDKRVAGSRLNQEALSSIPDNILGGTSGFSTPIEETELHLPHFTHGLSLSSSSNWAEQRRTTMHAQLVSSSGNHMQSTSADRANNDNSGAQLHGEAAGQSSLFLANDSGRGHLANSDESINNDFFRTSQPRPAYGVHAHHLHQMNLSLDRPSGTYFPSHVNSFYNATLSPLLKTTVPAGTAGMGFPQQQVNCTHSASASTNHEMADMCIEDFLVTESPTEQPQRNEAFGLLFRDNGTRIDRDDRTGHDQSARVTGNTRNTHSQSENRLQPMSNRDDKGKSKRQ